MTAYKVILIDDEIHCNESLEILLAECSPTTEVVAKFSDSADGLSWLKRNKVDLIFLDIEMPGMNGFDLLEELDSLDFDVIFVTAYDHYAIKAFQYSAVSYLLKPVDCKELQDTLLRWSERANKLLGRRQMELVHELLKQSNAAKKRVALPTNDGLEFIDIQQIVRCESDSNYTKIQCFDRTQHLICRTLKEVEKVLAESGFLRVHHSHLINPSYARRLVRTGGGSVIMDDGTEIPFSKGKRDSIYELLNNIERI